MLLGMRPDDPRYAALSLPTGASAEDGTLGCGILVSPVIVPLGRYKYAKGLRQDCTPPTGIAERVVPMHDQYWQTEEAMAEAARGESDTGVSTHIGGGTSAPGFRRVRWTVRQGWWPDRGHHLRG